MIQQWLSVRVVARQQEATDVCSFELADPEGRALPGFNAGAHIDVQVRDGLIRQYSLCNAPGEQHRYRIAVLREASGRGGSIALHDQIQQGDLINISAPRNHFPLAPGASRTVLLGGGIGVTPILCMAQQLAQANADFEMHYCTRSADRTAFADQIRQSSFADRVIFHRDDGDPAQKFDAAAVLANPVSGTHIYVCGPAGFMDYVLKTAKQLGWPDAQVHREYFAAAPQQGGVAQEFEVQIASTGQVLVIPADKAIAEVLMEHNIDITTSCDQGVCGTCLTSVLEGEPDHRDSFLTDEERARNDQMTPCCSRAKSRRLVLDL